MPELHQNAAAGVPPATLEAASRWASEDYDFALGCECADPALQIERWGTDDSESSAG